VIPTCSKVLSVAFKGGATDLKVGKTEYLRMKRAKKCFPLPPTFGIVGVHELNKVLLRWVAHFANLYYVLISWGQNSLYHHCDFWPSARSSVLNLIVGKLTIVNSQFIMLLTIRFRKPNLAVLHSCSYCKHAHCKLFDDDKNDKIICVF